MRNLYLLDATATETNAIRLRFIDADGRPVEITDDKYRPYFLVAYPLSEKAKETISFFSGEIHYVEKTDLFTGEKQTCGKICWPNPKIMLKAAERLGRCWESEIEFPGSYVYDKGLLFGAPHSEQGLKPVLDMPESAREGFEKTFRDTKTTDPLKYSQIAHWYSVINQPIPELGPEALGLKEEGSEDVYAAWMLSRIANIPLAEAFTSRRVSEWIKPMIHTYLRKNGILIPSEEELRRGKPTHTVTGALTVAPRAGIYFNTVVCDFESLYPSCIDSFNLSYETVDCRHPECISNRIQDVESHICQKRRGFYSILIGALKELRIKIFKPASKNEALPEEERKKAAAAAKLLKLILVSSYGVTVRIRGVACPPLAEAITGYGRYVLRESWKLAEEKGLKPLYGDTDSLFLDNASNEQVEWLIKTVKQRFRLDLIIDKRYSLCVLPKAKKAYFGILLDGTPDIKGVTAIKSNSPSYINKIFQQCVKELSTVNNLEEYELARIRIRKDVSNAIDDLKERKIGLEDLVFSVKLYFDPNEKSTETKMLSQPYQCALQLIESGRKLNRGNTVSFLKVKPFKHNGKTFTVKPAGAVTDPAELNMTDYTRNLLTALSQTFEPMGIKLEPEKETTISRWLSK